DGIRDLTVTGVQTCALPISITRPVETGPRSSSGTVDECAGDRLDVEVERLLAFELDRPGRRHLVAVVEAALARTTEMSEAGMGRSEERRVGKGGRCGGGGGG